MTDNIIHEFGATPVTVEATTITVGVFDMPGSTPGEPYVDFPAIEITSKRHTGEPDDVNGLTLDLDQAVKLAHRLLELAAEAQR